MRRPSIGKRDAFAAFGFVAVSTLAIAAVVAKARRDSADPARCAGLVPISNRCCAPGQKLEGGHCRGRPDRCPPPLLVTDAGCVAPAVRVSLAGGVLHAGAGDWEAEGRVQSREAAVGTFEIDAFEITEGRYAECVDAEGCRALSLSGEPGRALGSLTRSDAEAYCAFRGGRLPTDAEWTFAAGGTTSRRYPWGDTGAVCRRAAWGLEEGPCGFGFLMPELAGAHPDGVTPEGVHDLAGNVAEWVAAAAADDPNGFVRGGSFVSTFAADLRSWHGRKVRSSPGSLEIGGRCAYGGAP
jgi:formylglycine-generating enzyme required for sulfatase activity